MVLVPCPTSSKKPAGLVTHTDGRTKEETAEDWFKEKYPNARIIKDIGSGLNWNRPGFRSILERSHQGLISELVVSYKDRLCRFGYELVEWIFEKANVKLVVLNQNLEEQGTTRELSDDLLAITTVFVAKSNGLRAGQYRKERKIKEKLQESTKETIT
jgi:predicted site-specific integrase-resolvase